ncbi:uncharacterized protein LOC101863931 [Aplysia californica]|uniref:Uncharacterized protein LOC101863931 n=1 Tax=Aplysia californica TaxID=6500 RepID=A0ABM0K425_APLCA|nr:uncharacterized protein LOC101863931 [Aplysia californica]
MPTSSEALRLIRKYTDYVPSGPTLYRGPVPLPNVEIKRPITLPSVTICDVRGLTCYNQSRDGDSCSSDVRRVPPSMLQGASHKKLPPIHVPVGSTGSHPQPCLESPSLSDVRTGEREKG